MNPTPLRPFLQALILLWFALLASIIAAPYVFALDLGDFLVRNTIRLALVYWAIAVALMLWDNPFARVFWTLSCAAYLVHVVVSFEHVHRWSHAAAFNHVEAASGSGGGIFVSYFFTLLWSLDALWWWLGPATYRDRPRWLGWSIHSFMLFIIINGTMIFENGPTRWVSGAVLLALGMLWIKNRRVAASH